MAHYDVVVVGAGPAGNVAAHTLARGGANVALLEKQTLPRHKTCGGGIPMTASDVLAFDKYRDLVPEAFVEAEVRYMRHTFNFTDPVLAAMNTEGSSDREISLWMVQRSIFDYTLAQRAANAGAVLMDGIAVRDIQHEGKGAATVTVESRAGADKLTADLVIGADGANGITARMANLRQNRVLAIALEVEVPHKWGTGHPDLRKEICHLEYGAVPRGYAWVFPKHDHLNVGAGLFRPRRETGRGDSSIRATLQKTIRDYLVSLGLPNSTEDLHFYAHPLPIWNGLERIQTRNNKILLAGDSAGLINPLFGDGILHALKSGELAAEAYLNNDVGSYTKAIAAEFKSTFDAALKLSKFFYEMTGICYKYGVKRPNATALAARLLAGDALFTDVSRRALRKLRSALKTEPSEPTEPTSEG